MEIWTQIQKKCIFEFKLKSNLHFGVEDKWEGKIIIDIFTRKMDEWLITYTFNNFL